MADINIETDKSKLVTFDIGAAKLIPGPEGPQGPQGEKGDKGDTGNTGALIDLQTGIFAMALSDDGHLLVVVNDDQTPPDMEIDPETGHLIYNIV